MFGTQFVYGNPATSLATDGDLRIVGLQDGSAVTSRAVVIAAGVRRRRETTRSGRRRPNKLGDTTALRCAKTESQEVVMKRLWIVPFGLVFAAMIWLVIATLPDIKRYIRMHEM
jgi:hypothetical protein